MLSMKQILKEESGNQYKTLNDADWISDMYKKGKVEVWYVEPNQHREFIMGWSWLKKSDAKGTINSPLLIDFVADPLANLSQTHIMLGKMKGDKDMEKMWTAMQGERWSPEGEARSLIKKLGLVHTSMSVGDCFKIGKKIFMVDMSGFVEITK